MKKFATLMLTLVMLISCAAIGMAEDITLDVIICQYGTQTNDWFTGTGMNGTSFVKKFEEANPGIKLNLEVVSWNDVYTVVSTRISNNNAPDILNMLDGRIARSRNLITNFGKFMDPIADKLLTHTAFIMLTAIGRLNVTACIIFIAREFVVSGLRLCAVEQGHVIAAGMSGKIKTVLQMMLVVVLTITGEGLLPALLTIAAAVMTLYSMCEYVWQNRSVLGGAK